MIQKSKKTLLFLGKEGDNHCLKALEFASKIFSKIDYCLGKWGDPLPKNFKQWNGDYIISYLSRWIVPKFLLEQTKVAAINFHPASPEYPGIGCNNFALYEEADEYGVTCHHMKEKVDTGDIIAVKRFPILEDDDVHSILTRTYDFQLVLFYEILMIIARGEKLPISTENWSRKAFTRKEFNKLFQIDLSMSKEEIRKRVRATSFGTFQPVVNLFGYEFELKQNPSSLKRQNDS